MNCNRVSISPLREVIKRLYEKKRKMSRVKVVDNNESSTNRFLVEKFRLEKIVCKLSPPAPRHVQS